MYWCATCMSYNQFTKLIKERLTTCFYNLVPYVGGFKVSLLPQR